MDVVSIIIIIFLVFGAIIGCIRGFTRELVSLIGIFAVVVLAFLFKNPISVFLYTHLPFIKGISILKDVPVLNILFYEVVAFLILFCVFLTILRLLAFIASMFEKLLEFTIILGIPSKILGAVLGAVEAFIYVFVSLYVLKLPIFEQKYISKSKLADKILNSTPILTKICDKTLDVFNEVIEIKDKYPVVEDKVAFNQEILDVLIKDNIITKENAQMLIDNKKLDGLVVK